MDQLALLDLQDLPDHLEYQDLLVKLATLDREVSLVYQEHLDLLVPMVWQERQELREYLEPQELWVPEETAVCQDKQEAQVIEGIPGQQGHLASLVQRA